MTEFKLIIELAHAKEGPNGFPVCGSSNAMHSPLLGLCLKLPQGLYYMSANSKGSGETALMRRLA